MGPGNDVAVSWPTGGPNAPPLCTTTVKYWRGSSDEGRVSTGRAGSHRTVTCRLSALVALDRPVRALWARLGQAYCSGPLTSSDTEFLAVGSRKRLIVPVLGLCQYLCRPFACASSGGPIRGPSSGMHTRAPRCQQSRPWPHRTAALGCVEYPFWC